ncbi:AraC-like DNA-binding protein [Paenibacillus sp. BK033]|uniref:helix-turn-helix transcriptional regulator n=1 Tax=Paenibacillus sp. BK033 TaxID=2512133 RepID=UPI001045B16A|nr:AraC family transcriptional regulator [Paenibacillus sp. BK033]TCM99702.1 AraC-like DNA-binding protein [Paenibacillus sp. BK033]
MNHIHYVGSDAEHDRHFIFDIPQGHHCWLLVITKTPAQFWVNGELRQYPSHSAVLYRAHQKIYYKACTDKYVNDWIRFESDEPYVSNTSLPFGIPFSLDDPDYCHKLFELLVIEHNFDRDCKKSSIDCLLRTLFNKLLESYCHEGFTTQYYDILRLRAAIQNNPGDHWTVPKMAERLRISPGYLQTLYKKTFGISCMEDVISCRIRLAKEYLFQGSQTINEVARRCGYQNVEHFCRQFKQVTGYSPRKFQVHASPSEQVQGHPVNLPESSDWL